MVQYHFKERRIEENLHKIPSSSGNFQLSPFVVDHIREAHCQLSAYEADMASYYRWMLCVCQDYRAKAGGRKECRQYKRCHPSPSVELCLHTSEIVSHLYLPTLNSHNQNILLLLHGCFISHRLFRTFFLRGTVLVVIARFLLIYFTEPTSAVTFLHYPFHRLIKIVAKEKLIKDPKKILQSLLSFSWHLCSTGRPVLGFMAKECKLENVTLYWTNP